jgi:hypothetical protein
VTECVVPPERSGHHPHSRTIGQILSVADRLFLSVSGWQRKWIPSLIFPSASARICVFSFLSLLLCSLIGNGEKEEIPAPELFPHGGCRGTREIKKIFLFFFCWPFVTDPIVEKARDIGYTRRFNGKIIINHRRASNIERCRSGIPSLQVCCFDCANI